MFKEKIYVWIFNLKIIKHLVIQSSSVPNIFFDVIRPHMLTFYNYNFKIHKFSSKFSYTSSPIIIGVKLGKHILWKLVTMWP